MSMMWLGIGFAVAAVVLAAVFVAMIVKWRRKARVGGRW